MSPPDRTPSAASPSPRRWFGFSRFHRGRLPIMDYRACWYWNIILPFCVIAVGRWYTRRICVSVTR